MTTPTKGSVDAEDIQALQYELAFYLFSSNYSGLGINRQTQVDDTVRFILADRKAQYDSLLAELPEKKETQSLAWGYKEGRRYGFNVAIDQTADIIKKRRDSI